jgi:hypothetical protein
VPCSGKDRSLKLHVAVSVMSYETWEVVNTISMLAVIFAPIVLAIVVFVRQRRHRGADGKRVGRPVLWSFVTAFFSFLAFVVVWGLTLQEAFPDYSARWRAENEQPQDRQPDTGVARADNANIIDGIVGQWRPNNARRTDYFAFTAETYSSINPEFDTTLTWNYEVMRRDGPCMRIRMTHVVVVQGGQITRDGPTRGDPFVVCVDPATDTMLIRFENSEGGDVFFTRMD